MKIIKLFGRAVIGAVLFIALYGSAAAQYAGSGAQPVTRGATGRDTLVPNALLFGNGTAPIGFLSPASLPGRCVVSDGTIWAARFCLVTGSIIGTDPITVDVAAGVATVGLTFDANFEIISNALALKAISSGSLIANCGASSAEPTACSASTWLNRNISNTDGNFAARIGGVWTAAFPGTGLAFSASALNLQPASAGTIGGINSIAQVASKVVQFIDTAGLPHLVQLGFTDLSGSLASSQCPNATTSATGCVQGDNATLSLSSGLLSINLARANTWTAAQTFPNNSLTLAEFPVVGAGKVIGSVAGGTPAELSQTQLTSLCNLFTTTLNGCVPNSVATTGKFLSDSGWTAISVGLTLPTIFNVSGSPVTPGGTITASLASQAQNLILASPNGSSGAPSFRSIALPDLPTSVASLTTQNQTLSGGANVTSAAQTTGNITVNCGVSPLQSITNGGAFTITAPANDGSCILAVTNNASAGLITFSGFSVGANTGSALTTINGNKFSISIWRINGTAAFTVFAHQ